MRKVRIIAGQGRVNTGRKSKKGTKDKKDCNS